MEEAKERVPESVTRVASEGVFSFTLLIKFLPWTSSGYDTQRHNKTAGYKKSVNSILPVRCLGPRKTRSQTDRIMTLTPKVNICTRKVCLRLMKPLHTNGTVITFPKHLLCNVLVRKLEFPRFKRPKTKRCKRCSNMSGPHLHRPRGSKYGANSRQRYE